MASPLHAPSASFAPAARSRELGLDLDAALAHLAESAGASLTLIAAVTRHHDAFVASVPQAIGLSRQMRLFGDEFRFDARLIAGAAGDPVVCSDLSEAPLPAAWIASALQMGATWARLGVATTGDAVDCLVCTFGSGSPAGRKTRSGFARLLARAGSAWTDERAGLRDGNAMLVVQSDGAVSGLSGAASRWLRKHRMARVLRWCGEVLREEQPATRRSIDGAEARFALLERPRRIAVMIDASADAPLLPQDSLAPRVREAAEFAAVGATAKEIGSAMGMSHDTARGYLKIAYRQLGVASRIDLARAMRR